MKTGQHFSILFILLTVVQILVGNYCNFSEYILISILPVTIFCIPLSVGTVPAMLFAFFSGLATDWLTEGLVGLNAFSLVPVALIRKPLIQIILGKDHIVRNEDISFRKNGFGKVALALIVVQTVFLTIYIITDGAGTRPIWFNLTKFAVSLGIGFILSLIVANTIISTDKK